MYKTTFLALSLILFSFTATAQKNIKEGSVTFELSEISPDSPEMQMMKGSRMKITFDKKKQALEMDMMGGLMNIKTIIDTDKEESVTLTDMMGDKTLVKMSKEEYEKQKEKQASPNFEITYDKNDTKEIVGYQCYKAVLKDTSGNVINIYVTEDIKTKVKYFEQMFPGLNVFPMEFAINNSGISMVFSAQEFLTKLAADAFEYSTEGYTEMTLEEFEKSIGAMGGMGF